MSISLYGRLVKTAATRGLLLGGLGLFCTTANAEEVAPVSYEEACDMALSCDEGCCDSVYDACSDEGCCCFGDDSGIDIGGWMQWGYHTDANGLFNNHPHRVNLHQMWIYAEKVADGSEGLDWGFRADLMYGVDAQDTQAFGNPPGTYDYQNGWDHGIYGWALPQLYAEVAMGDMSVKVGHFFTLIGYEVVTAPDNFFYSHAYTMYNSEPFTHTGALMTYNVSDSTTVYGGWTAGWDTGFERFNDGDNSDGSNFLGGISQGFGDNLTVTYINTIGDFGTRGEGYSHSIVADFTLTDDLNYVVQSDLVETNLDAARNNHQYSFNQYLFYTINDMLKAGVRAEWWKNGGDSQYEVTGGVNVRPTDYLVVRPEIRHDWNPNMQQDFTTFGIDAILTY